MFVKPGPRQDDRDRPLVVRAPTGRCLSPSGEDVPETQFWHRRLRDGDVVAATPVPTAKDPIDEAPLAVPDEAAVDAEKGEPLRLTAIEWASLAAFVEAGHPPEAFDGRAGAVARDPAEPLITRQEFQELGA
jgi:hypothetical protein